jgi:uncharacterized surface protein with fasciclin (FAS1) repeats
MRTVVAMTALALLVASCGQEGGGNQQTNLPLAENGAAPTAAGGTLGSLLSADPRFAQLIAAAGMQPVLEGKTPYTVLAPTPEALNALPAGTLERLQQPAGRAELTGLLRRHILPGTVLREDLDRTLQGASRPVTVATMAGDPLPITREGDTIRIGRARLVGPEQRASNGVVHRIDAILAAPAPAGSGN